jgi:hypothetical protein
MARTTPPSTPTAAPSMPDATGLAVEVCRMTSSTRSGVGPFTTT